MSKRIDETTDFTGLKKAEKTLPSTWYYDPDHHAHELDRIWYRSWLYVCRSDALDQAPVAAGAIAGRDWDRDGFTDLFFAIPDAGPQNDRFFFRAIGDYQPSKSADGLVRLELRSPQWVNNYAGLGARVSVTLGNQTLRRWVTGDPGGDCGTSDGLAVPVDAGPGIVPVTVLWPNGWQQQASVPLATSGSAPTVILDDTNPSVVDASVAATAEYDPIAQQFWWVFTWETVYRSDETLDTVTLITANLPTECVPGSTVFTPDMAGVDHATNRLATGRYRHTLRVRADCEPNCRIPFTVTSTHRAGISSTSSQKWLKITFCPNQL